MRDTTVMTIKDRYKLRGLIGEVITILEPRVNELMKEYVTSFVEKFKTTPSKFDLECAEVHFVFDIIKSFGKYTKPTDVIVEIDSSTSIKGNLEITALIERDGVRYPFRTEAIYAGGYNIQRLHYRYITKTKLPKEVSPLVKKFNEKIKKMNKLQRLEAEATRFEKYIKETQSQYEEYKEYDDEERLNHMRKQFDFRWPAWEVICERGADKNFDYSEEKYNEHVEKSRLEDLERFEKTYVVFKKRRVEYLEKELIKIKSKIEDIK